MKASPIPPMSINTMEPNKPQNVWEEKYNCISNPKKNGKKPCIPTLGISRREMIPKQPIFSIKKSIGKKKKSQQMK